MAGQLRIWQGDITRLDVDAIVNAANSSLLGGGGVDGAIHRAAGPRLRAHCAGLGGCPTGEARITPGFDLPARWIIHTVGPVWHGGQHGEAALLESCYRACFRLALEHDIRRLAFPAISCGVYGYPAAEAAAIALRESQEALARHSAIEEILLVAFDRTMHELLELTRRNMRPADPASP
jgi:O-acetyl-ADP-ribose deacetylase